MRKNLLNLLYEQLILENRRSELVHFTSIENLISIIKKGVLLGFEYEESSTDKKGRVEVATLRRSMEKTYKKDIKKMAQLTLNSGGVKIYIFDKNIKSSLRGSKIKPISEYGKIFDYKKFIKNITDFVEDVKSKNVTVKAVEEFIDTSLKDLSKRISPSKIRESLYIKTSEMGPIYKKFEEKFKISLNDFQKMFLATAMRTRTYSMFPQTAREGEERISVKGSVEKQSGIPVDPRFMKIRIEKKPYLREFYDAFKNDAERLMIIKKIESSGNLFLKDKNFYYFLNMLKNTRIY